MQFSDSTNEKVSGSISQQPYLKDSIKRPEGYYENAGTRKLKEELIDDVKDGFKCAIEQENQAQNVPSPNK